MQKLTQAFVVLAAAVVIPPVFNATVASRPALADEAELPGADTQFLAKAIVSGRNEVELSQLAAQKAAQPDVKHFAEHMVKEHTAVNEKLMNEAQRHKINTKGTYGTPPLEPSPEAQATKNQLSGLSGDKLDKAYMQKMIDDHVQAIAMFKDEAKDGKDSALRTLADTVLPNLEQHLKEARAIGSKIGTES